MERVPSNHSESTRIHLQLLPAAIAGAGVKLFVCAPVSVCDGSSCRSTCVGGYFERFLSPASSTVGNVLTSVFHPRRSRLPRDVNLIRLLFDFLFFSSSYFGLQDGPYPWAIVSDPLRAFLFVLVRDPATFYGSDLESDLLKLCKDLGFTAFWNSPRKTVQDGCTYTAAATAAADGIADVLAEPAVAGTFF